MSVVDETGADRWPGLEHQWLNMTFEKMGNCRETYWPRTDHGDRQIGTRLTRFVQGQRHEGGAGRARALQLGRGLECLRG